MTSNTFMPIMLHDAAGQPVQDRESLSLALGHTLDVEAFGKIMSVADRSTEDGLHIARVKAGIQKAIANRKRGDVALIWRCMCREFVATRNIKRGGLIWSSERQQYRVTVISCRERGGAIAEIIGDAAASTDEMMAYRESARRHGVAGYPYDLMTDAEALAVQRASGVVDDYVPLGVQLARAFGGKKEMA